MLDADYIEIRVKGKEKASFMYTKTEVDSDGSDRGEVESERRKKKYESTHMDVKFKAFTFQDGPLAPGDYTIPFEFDLPANLPASVIWKRKDHYDKPSIRIQYSVKSILHTHSKKVLKYKQQLLIHEPPVQFAQNAGNQ